MERLDSEAEAMSRIATVEISMAVPQKVKTKPTLCPSCCVSFTGLQARMSQGRLHISVLSHRDSRANGANLDGQAGRIRTPGHRTIFQP